MRRIQKSTADLSQWLLTHDVYLHSVQIDNTEWGSGIITRKTVTKEQGPLIQVPSRLVLSQRYIAQQAEHDYHLKACLEAVGDFGKTARGAILVFLLLQIAATSPDVQDRIGVENPWTTYVQFLPNEEGLPTFWTEPEQKMALATTLEPALAQKLKSLHREFKNLSEGLATVPWCRRNWIDNGVLTFDDWKVVDAIYRSRAMELPLHGLCMVPIADMANHGHGEKVNARTDVDAFSGIVRIVLDGQNQIAGNREVMISYGDEKGACEMLFSYGFIDMDMSRAESMFLDLEDPEDDPIFLAKKQIFDCAPGFRITFRMSKVDITWVGGFVWLMCINEEDGLEMVLEKQPDNSKILRAFWKGRELKDVVRLDSALRTDEMADLFKLRGYAIVNERIKSEILRREKVMTAIRDESVWFEQDETNSVWRNTSKLRYLENQMLHLAEAHFSQMIGTLYSSKVINKYFNGTEDSQDLWAWKRDEEDEGNEEIATPKSQDD